MCSSIIIVPCVLTTPALNFKSTSAAVNSDDPNSDVPIAPAQAATTELDTMEEDELTDEFIRDSLGRAAFHNLPSGKHPKDLIAETRETLLASISHKKNNPSSSDGSPQDPPKNKSTGDNKKKTTYRPCIEKR